MIYLDNSATTRVCAQAADAAYESMRTDYFNPSAPYAPAIAAETRMTRARANVARALTCDAGGVYFTSGGTEGDNLVILGTANVLGRRMHHMITTAVEHPAVLHAMQYLEKTGWEVSYIPVDGQGCCDEDALVEALREDTALVSVMHVNNEVGAINDVARIAARVKRKNPRTLVHVDGVQAFMRVPVALVNTGIDFYSVSGHKIHAPKGVGALYMKKGARIDGMQLGGGQESGVRSGTENVPGIAALGAAVERLLDEGQAQVAARLMGMKRTLYAQIIDSVPDVRVNGPQDIALAAPHVLNLSFAGVRAEVLLHALEEREIYVGMGSACSSKRRVISPVLRAMQVPAAYAEGAIRFSLGCDNTMDEMARTAETLASLVAQLRRFKRR
nr:cysteine desulfurase family protein [Maliibacterium massiliense]